MSEKITVRDRIKKVLIDNGNASIYSLGNNENERTNMSRQINGSTKVSLETIERVLERYPEVSAEWLIRGEGLMERTKIVTPPAHHQDIHIAEGARAAISQSGDANMTLDNEPIGNPTFTSLLNEKDDRIAELEKNIETLKDTIRILSAK